MESRSTSGCLHTLSFNKNEEVTALGQSGKDSSEANWIWNTKRPTGGRARKGRGKESIMGWGSRLQFLSAVVSVHRSCDEREVRLPSSLQRTCSGNAEKSENGSRFRETSLPQNQSIDMRKLRYFQKSKHFGSDYHYFDDVKQSRK